jgi:hypothetical protein
MLAHAVFFSPVRSRRQLLNPLTLHNGICLSRLFFNAASFSEATGTTEKIVLGGRRLAQGRCPRRPGEHPRIAYKRLIAKVLLTLSCSCFRFGRRPISIGFALQLNPGFVIARPADAANKFNSQCTPQRQSDSRSKPFGAFATIDRCDLRSRKIPDLTLKASYGNSSRSAVRSGQ